MQTNIEMPQWEKELREKLNKQLPDDRTFLVTSPGFSIMLGKQSYIEWEVQLKREAELIK